MFLLDLTRMRNIHVCPKGLCSQNFYRWKSYFRQLRMYKHSHVVMFENWTTCRKQWMNLNEFIKQMLRLQTCTTFIRNDIIWKFFLFWITPFNLNQTVAPAMASKNIFTASNFWTHFKFFRKTVRAIFLIKEKFQVETML